MPDITISISQELADRLEATLAKHLKPPRQDPETKAIVQEAMFPNGIADWIAQIIAANAQGMIGQSEQAAAEAEIAAIHERMRAKFKPTVAVK